MAVASSAEPEAEDRCIFGSQVGGAYYEAALRCGSLVTSFRRRKMGTNARALGLSPFDIQVASMPRGRASVGKKDTEFVTSSPISTWATDDGGTNGETLTPGFTRSYETNNARTEESRPSISPSEVRGSFASKDDFPFSSGQPDRELPACEVSGLKRYLNTMAEEKRRHLRRNLHLGKCLRVWTCPSV